MGKKEFENLSLRSIEEERRKLEKKRKKIMIPCTHSSKKGNPKGTMEGNKFTCELCGATFSITKISMDELHEAASTLHNAINQIKLMSDNPEQDSSLIDVLGNTDFNINEVVSLYRNMTQSGKKKKKNKNRNRDGRGANGGYTNGQAISFVDGGYGKKKKYY